MAAHKAVTIMETIPTGDDALGFTGTQINYLFVCKRKLWLSSHGITMEHTSDNVHIGKLVHEFSYPREPKKEIELGPIKIDFLKGAEVHEVKKSRKLEDAHVFQMLYYLYHLKHRFGVVAKGTLDYPVLRKRVEVELTPEKEADLEGALGQIKTIIGTDLPPEPAKLPYCRKCSYYEFCWC